mmetsp:Transcript_56770/g.93938  ORF Transcript_56770/g.93938 Transcript_56770/m.93938 type:complete len:359 (-) Transcript_56770:414-1490(-)
MSWIDTHNGWGILSVRSMRGTLRCNQSRPATLRTSWLPTLARIALNHHHSRLTGLQCGRARQNSTELLANHSGESNFAALPSLASVATLQLVKLAKEAISDLYTLQHADVQSAVARQEEAFGLLLGSLLGHKLPPFEAGKVGNKAGIALKTAKAKDESIRSNGSAKRAKARKQAEKSVERAAGLNERLNDINKACEAARAALWGTKIDLGLPEMRPHATRTATEPKTSTLARLRTAERKAADAVVVFEAQAAAAAKEAESAKEKLEKISARLHEMVDEEGPDADEEWERLQAAFEAKSSEIYAAAAAADAADQAADEARARVACEARAERRRKEREAKLEELEQKRISQEAKWAEEDA